MTLFDKASIDAYASGKACAADRDALLEALSYGVEKCGEMPLLTEAKQLLQKDLSLNKSELRTVEHALVLVDLGMRE